MKDTTMYFLNQTPFCTKHPLKSFFTQHPGLRQKLSNRSIRDYGRDYFADWCDRVAVCGGSMCVRRPIPCYEEIEDEMLTLQSQLNATSPKDAPRVTRETIKCPPYTIDEKTGKFKYSEKPVWYIKQILCDKCPINKECPSICGTMEDFSNRKEEEDDIYAKNEEMMRKRGKGCLTYFNREEEIHNKISYEDYDFAKPLENRDRSEIPWEVLTPLQKQIVWEYDFNWKDLDEIQEITGLKSKKHINEYRNAALKKLRKKGKENDRIKELDKEWEELKTIATNNGIDKPADLKRYEKVIVKLKEMAFYLQVYKMERNPYIYERANGKTLNEIAKKYGTTYGKVQRTIANIIKNYQ